MGRAAIGLAGLCFLFAALFVACVSVSTSSPVSSSIAQPARLNATNQMAAGSGSPLPALPSDASGQSRVITDDLKAHHLPLVGASMAAGEAGRQLTLYGYVATQQGKTNAEDRARRILNDPDVPIVNRIVIEPQLLAMDTNAGSAAPAPNPSSPSAPQTWPSSRAWADAQNYAQNTQIQAYEAHQQGQSDWTNWIVPVLMIALMFVP